MFADFSQSKGSVLLQLQGLEEYPEFEKSIRDYVKAEFPIDDDELASINEDTYEVITGVMTDIIMLIGDNHDIDFSDEDSELDFAVVGIIKIAPSRVIISVSFINPYEDEDSDEDNDDAWE